MAPEDSSGASTGRRYTDKEVALVIKRASELQASEAVQSDAESAGLSLAELEQIAREAGIDPTLVRRAAQDIDSHHTTAAPSRFLGAPSAITIERTIRGEVPSSEYEAIVEILRCTFNDPGLISTFGRSLAWNAVPNGRHAKSRRVNVTVTVRNGNTVIRGEESLRGVAGGLFGGLMGGMGGGSIGPALSIGALTHSVLLGVGTWGLIAAGSYGLARTIFGRVAARRGEQLRVAVEQVAEHVGAVAVVSPPLSAPSADSTPRLGLPGDAR